MSLQEQIELAQRSLRAMKRNPATRVMLPEYLELQRAKAELDRAKARLKAAQVAWDALGEPLDRRRPASG